VKIRGAYPDEGKFMQNSGFFWACGLHRVVIFALALSAAPAWAGESHQWLWSETSALINRSTEALAGGHYKRAERFAVRARESAAHASDLTILLHNLCLARMSTRGSATASDDCAAAVQSTARLTAEDNRLVLMRGRLLPASTAAEGETFSLSEIVQANIARAYGWHMVDHMRQNTPPPW